MMEWITVTLGKETRRVRPRGLDDIMAQGWTLVGAKAPEAPKEPQGQPVDAGQIKVRAPRKKQ